MKTQNLIRFIQTLNVQNVAAIPVEKIVFDRAFRSLCEANSCGVYGKNWMCPPCVGEIDPLIARAKGYLVAVVYQTIGALEDSYDFEGMMAAGENMSKINIAVKKFVANEDEGALVLGGGACRVCERCAKLDEKPCRNPTLAMPSLESHGVNVSALAQACGMRYINGENTVTYFGAVLFCEDAE
jgi:predicted metal-binding protein